MLIQRVDQYRIKVTIKSLKIIVDLGIKYLLNQKNLNTDGEYKLQFYSIKDLETGKEIGFDSQNTFQKLAFKVKQKFDENPTNFIGLAASEISIK